LGLPILEEAQTRREVSDHGGCLVPQPGKRRRCPRLVMVLQESCQPVLIIEGCPKMRTYGAGIAIPEAIAEPLVVAIIEALLLQLPFKTPIGLGEKGEAGMRLARQRDCLFPEGRRR